LLLALSVLFVATAVVAVAVHRHADMKGPAPDEPTALSWPPNLDEAEAAQLLADFGLVENLLAVELFFRATNAASCFRSGPHFFSRAHTPRELRAMLCRSAARPAVTVTFPEGYDRFDMAERLEARGVVSGAAFLRATEDVELLASLAVELGIVDVAKTAEGYLFPATYELSLDSEPSRLVRRFVATADARWKDLAINHREGVDQLRSDLGYGRREVMILASMVEKEAAMDDERPIIASVFLNRLRFASFKPKYLQSDPTSTYGCRVMSKTIAACTKFAGRPTPALNRDRDNIYSTYVTKRLPPGPITNPGAKSIAAVLAPADTDYLFFVAKGGRRHRFSKTYDEHRNAIPRDDRE